jgi:hypothetical protein
MEQTLGVFWAHAILFLSGSTAFAIIAHAVSTFPTPKNIYGQWLLGVVKFTVGQRISAANAFAGYQSEVAAVTDEQKEALANGSTLQIVKLPDGTTKPLPLSGGSARPL